MSNVITPHDTLPAAVVTDDEQHALNVLLKARRNTIRPRLKTAISVYVTEGLSIADSARRAGMTPHSLQVALKKPHVIAYVSDVKRAWLDNRTSKAWFNIADLADRAASEEVRLKANRVFLEAAGELGGKGDDSSKVAATLVNIIVHAAQNTAQLTDGQLSGVIEAQPWRAIGEHPSNSPLVGREDSGDDEH